MHLGLLVPKTIAALDPFGWIIAIIILLNILSPLFSRRRARANRQQQQQQQQAARSTAATPAQAAGTQARSAPASPLLRRPLQSIAQRSFSQRVSLSDADKEKLRQALAAAGVSTLASELERRVGTVSATATVTVTQPVRATLAAPPRTGPAQPVPAALPSFALPDMMLPTPELPPMPTADGLTLMTLESGPGSFDRLLSGATLSPTAPTSTLPALGMLNNPRALANAFVAAAIVGPCAALRPLGHTPAGW